MCTFLTTITPKNVDVVDIVTYVRKNCHWGVTINETLAPGNLSPTLHARMYAQFRTCTYAHGYHLQCNFLGIVQERI